jgi:hypothetical protein
MKNDTVWGWGDKGTGNWGNGSSLDGSISPVQVRGYNGLVTLAAIVNPDTVLRYKTDNSIFSTADDGKNMKPSVFTMASR